MIEVTKQNTHCFCLACEDSNLYGTELVEIRYYTSPNQISTMRICSKCAKILKEKLTEIEKK